MRPTQTVPLKLKFSSNTQEGSFSGYASTFGGQPDSYGEIIAPGAFTDSINEHIKNGTMPALLWQHDQTNPIGRWETLEEDNIGLVANGHLTLDVPQAKSAHALMKDGALALSIGFIPDSNGYERLDGYMLLKKANLIEISVVSIPANTNARITSIKSAFDPDKITQREFERTTREALGLSARQAKRLMAGGWSGLVREEQPDDSEDLSALAESLQSITNSIKSRSMK